MGQLVIRYTAQGSGKEQQKKPKEKEKS